MIVFTLSIVYFTSATVVFFRDLSQIINIFMQVVMWMTPIMWDLDSLMVSPVIKTILKLNPMFYVVNGYRDSLINNVWFWQQPGMTVYFWSVTAILFAIGSVVFRRLQVHFADVL
jgi:teichoic acid transport system permease protein